ncbi:MAG TPA: tetratricopeptide repeat protein [Candidatus Kapabacteria bacterium]|nr:tetratricopeptide repeat protein [Candidatus Kapabacteria bacterium]
MIRSQKKLSENVGPEVQELTQSEKVILGYQKTASWVQTNSRIVIGGAVVFVALVIGFFIWHSKQQEASDRAEILYSRIAPYYRQNDWRRAIDGDPSNRIQNEPIAGLRQIAADYGSTKAGQSAKLALGNCYYYLGKLDSALMAFSDISTDLPLIKASAQAGKAAILEDKGNKADAAKLFLSAASVEQVNPLNADYSYAAARDLEQAGNKDEAVKVYRKILEDYQGTYFDDGAKRALIRLNVPL